MTDKLIEAAAEFLSRDTSTKVLDEAKIKVGHKVSIHYPGTAAHGKKGVVGDIKDGQAKVHIGGALGVQKHMKFDSGAFVKPGTKVPVGKGGKGISLGGTTTHVPVSALKRVDEELDLYEEFDLDEELAIALGEVEQLDELSPELLHRAANKAEKIAKSLRKKGHSDAGSTMMAQAVNIYQRAKEAERKPKVKKSEDQSMLSPAKQRKEAERKQRESEY